MIFPSFFPFSAYGRRHRFDFAPELVLVTASVFLAAIIPSRADLLVQPHDVVAVCDDSFPGPRASSVFLADYLLMCHPVSGVRVMNLGMNRESIENFMKRVESDLAPLQPNVAITSLGTGEGQAPEINPAALGYHTRYRAQTIDELKKIGAHTVVLASTSCFDSPGGTAWNKNLETLRDADREVAVRTGAVFADPLSVQLDAMPKIKAKYGDKYVFSFDGFHQTGSAQLIKAYTYLKALGCDGKIGTISVDLAANKATGSDGQKILSCQDGNVEIESTRYPFCFTGSPEKADSTSGIINFFPFNEDLNRYLLVVKGLRSANAKVTWGIESHVVPTADLLKGINLAAIFAGHTPFETTFAKVESVVWQQQEPQPVYALHFFHRLADYKAMIPDQAGLVDQLSAAIITQDKNRAADAEALVVPVRHTLKIEEQP